MLNFLAKQRLIIAHLCGDCKVHGRASRSGLCQLHSRSRLWQLQGTCSKLMEKNVSEVDHTGVVFLLFHFDFVVWPILPISLPFQFAVEPMKSI